MLLSIFIAGNNVSNALKGIEPDSSDSSDNESKDPYKLKDELAAVGKLSMNTVIQYAVHKYIDTSAQDIIKLFTS